MQPHGSNKSSVYYAKNIRGCELFYQIIDSGLLLQHVLTTKAGIGLYVISLFAIVYSFLVHLFTMPLIEAESFVSAVLNTTSCTIT